MSAVPPAEREAPLPPCLRHLVSAPPFALLADRIARLERAGIVVALGGSGLLAALSLTDRVRDWDLTTDAPRERVLSALGDEPHTFSEQDALHADQKLAFVDGIVEVILGFAFHTDRGVVRIPTRVSSRVDGLPLGSPEAWAVAYHLLGRAEKSERLFGWLERQGADAGTRATLLSEPLPGEIAERLARLSTSRST